jgi:hypothetical protein
MINGGEAYDRGGGGILIVSPSQDALQEFKVVTSNYAADLGQSSGGMITMATKSGTKQFHGGAWEYFRNDKLDAHTFFANFNGKPKPKLRYNTFGFNLGGPIPIQKERKTFMSQSARNILRTGDICEIENFNEETFAIYIEGKLYVAFPKASVFEVLDFEERVIRILRPLKLESSLDLWRYADENTWRVIIASPPLGGGFFKTVYIKNKPVGITINILEKDLGYLDAKVTGCIKNIVEYHPEYTLNIIYDVIRDCVYPLICKEYYLTFNDSIISVYKTSDHTQILEIIEIKNEGEK